MTYRIEYRRDHAATVWTELHAVYPPLVPIYGEVIAEQNAELGYEKYRVVEIPATLQIWRNGEWQHHADLSAHELEAVSFWVDAQNAHAGFEQLRIVEIA